MENKRLLWVDAVRGCLILVVILGHALQHGDYGHSIAWNLIYSFHMAAFFCISGYVSYKPQLKMDIVIKRAKQLIIPFSIWGVFQSICMKKSGWQLFDFYLYPDRGFWFIYALFFIILITVLIDRISVKIKIKRNVAFLIGNLILIALMAVFNWRVFGFQFIAFYLFFYLGGFFIRQYNIKLSLMQSICAGIMWFMVAIFYRWQEVPVPLQALTMIPSTILIYGYRYLTGIIGGGIFIMGISPYVFNKANSLINLILGYLGRASLGIYIIHMFVAHMMDYYHIIEPYFESTTSVTYTIIFFIICTVFGVGLEAIFSKNKYLSFLLLGKQRSLPKNKK